MIYAAAFLLAAAAVGVGLMAGPEAWASFWPWAAQLIASQDVISPLAALGLGAAALAALAIARAAAPPHDRRWREARDVVADDVARDADRLLHCVDALIQRERSLDAATAVFEFANDERLHERLLYLKPAFTGEMALYISEYMERRTFLARTLYSVDSDPAALHRLFARRGGGEWRFGDLPTRAQGATADDYEALWRALRTIGDMATLVAERPMAGWRTRRAHRAVVNRARAVARRFAS